MGVNVVNWSELHYEEEIRGVRFGLSRARISERLEARKLRYEAWVVPPGRADRPLRHHQVAEHVLLVLGGEPTLRLGAVEHPLAAGDVAAIPPRAALAWQLRNRSDRPAHVFVAATRPENDVIALPDSGKQVYRLPGEPGGPAFHDVVVRGEHVVDLWDGEPVDTPLRPVPPAPAARDPRIANLQDVAWEPFGHGPFRGERKRLATRVGAERLGYSLYRLLPGQHPFPFHYHRLNEEFFYVRRGYGEMRTATGTRPLRPGDAIVCPAGPDGAHAFHNDGDGPLVYFALSTTIEPDVVEYPDA